MIYDSHAHMDFLPPKKLKEIEENKEIGFVVTNSVNIKSCKDNLEISKKYSKIKLALGLYPEATLKEKDLEELKILIKENKPIALGEIGLDFTQELPKKELQISVFKGQLDIAQELKIPAIIHTRKAEKEVLEILQNFPKSKKILHCFSGNFKLIREANKLGCYFSIPTNIVRSEHFQKMIEILPKEKILTETDSPYLSPFKEKSNEPLFIKESIKKISEIWNLSKKETEKIIEDNFKRIFRIRE